VFTGNGANGVSIDGSQSTGTITATLSVAAAANEQGIAVSTLSGHAGPVVMVTDSKLVNNSVDGLIGFGGVTVFVDRTQISGNGGNGWEAVGAVVESYTNNEVNGNADDSLNGVTQITSE
jgi:hypothetical protein